MNDSNNLKDFSIINNGIVRLDKRFNIIAIDTNLTLLFNRFFSIAEAQVQPQTSHLIGQQWQNIIASIQGATQHEHWLIASQFHTDQTAQLTLAINDDNHVELTLRYSPVFDGNNHLIEMLVFIVIVEATEQIKQDLQAEKAFYRAVVQDMPALIYRYTTEGIVTLANDELCHYFAAKVEDIVGMSIYDVMDAENVAGARAHLASITPENPILSHEHSGTDKAGNTRWYQWTDRLILSDDGKPLGYQGIGLDLTERKHHEEELHRLASTDALTGLFNRRQCIMLGKQALARCVESNCALSLLVVDIDFFKKVNDRFGHIAGDQVIQQFANTCLTLFRDTDLIGRYGGEEFIIILPETDQDDALMTGERLRHAVENMDIPFEECRLNITISIGIATSHNTANISLDNLLAKADQALYQAKATGRNKVVTWAAATP